MRLHIMITVFEFDELNTQGNCWTVAENSYAVPKENARTTHPDTSTSHQFLPCWNIFDDILHFLSAQHSYIDTVKL